MQTHVFRRYRTPVFGRPIMLLHTTPHRIVIRVWLNLSYQEAYYNGLWLVGINGAEGLNTANQSRPMSI